jgi:hypothetical protein
MTTPSPAVHALHEAYPVDVTIEPAMVFRDRLTCAFRPILAIPHLILVGGPMAFAITWLVGSEGERMDWGSGGGVLGAVAVVIALIAWFAIVFTGRFPEGLWKLSAFYMRWRVRAMAYTALLRDEYPPFGDGDYPATMTLTPPEGERDRLSVAFRLILAIPHLVLLWVIGIAWALVSIVAWFFILFAGRYPRDLYEIAVGALRYTTRVEAYLLLLRDEYPPFAFDGETL